MKTGIAKSQRGFGTVGIIIVIVVIAVIGVVAWKVSSNNNKSPAGTPVSKTVAAADSAAEKACNQVYSDKDLCKFAASAGDFETTAYTAVDTSTDTSGATTTATISSDGKGDNEITTTNAGQSYAAITIGNSSYIKQGGSTTWLKYTSTASPTTNPTSDIKPDFSQATTPVAQRIKYVKIDSEKCGNLTCLKYQIIDPSTPNTTEYAWFDTTNFRLQQWQSKDATSTNDFVITYTNVKISVPSPVTDASTPSTGASGSSGSLTPAEQAEIQAAEQAAAGHQ